jgi:hypothetical protein
VATSAKAEALMPRTSAYHPTLPFKRAKRHPGRRKVGKTILYRSVVGWVDRTRDVSYRKEGSKWCVRGLRGQRVAYEGRCYKSLKSAVRTVNKYSP